MRNSALLGSGSVEIPVRFLGYTVTSHHGRSHIKFSKEKWTFTWRLCKKGDEKYIWWFFSPPLFLLGTRCARPVSVTSYKSIDICSEYNEYMASHVQDSTRVVCTAVLEHTPRGDIQCYPAPNAHASFSKAQTPLVSICCEFSCYTTNPQQNETTGVWLTWTSPCRYSFECHWQKIQPFKECLL